MQIVQILPPMTVSSIASVSPNPRNTPVTSIDVTFSVPIDTTSLAPGAIALSDDGQSVSTAGVSLALVSGTTYAIDGLGSVTAAEGSYALTVNAADITDQYGNPGTGSLSTSWLMDTTPPTSTVNPLPATTTSTSFSVSVTGSDPTGSDGGPPSGVASFAIYDSEDGGPFALLATLTPADPETTFTGADGRTYGFYSIATDNAGNVQPTPAAAQATTEIVGAAVETGTSVQSSENPSKLGDTVTFTATVTPDQGSATPTGSVQFVIDGNAAGNPIPLDAGGVATYTTSSLSVGSHTVAADYLNTDGSFIDSSGSLAGGQTVTTADTTITVKSNIPTSVYGQWVTFTVSVAAVTAGLPTPTGTVELFDGAVELGMAHLRNGAARLTINSLPVGADSITAVYSGDGKFSTSTTLPLGHTVNQDGTSTTVRSSADPARSGRPITFRATVKAAAPGSGTPTGTVTFMDGSTPLGTVALRGGSASLRIASLADGTHLITAVYSGDADFTASTSPIFKQVVDVAVAAAPAVPAASLVDQVLGALTDDSSGDSVAHDLGLEAVVADGRRSRAAVRS